MSTFKKRISKLTAIIIAGTVFLAGTLPSYAISTDTDFEKDNIRAVQSVSASEPEKSNETLDAISTDTDSEKDNIRAVQSVSAPEPEKSNETSETVESEPLYKWECSSCKKTNTDSNAKCDYCQKNRDIPTVKTIKRSGQTLKISISHPKYKKFSLYNIILKSNGKYTFFSARNKSNGVDATHYFQVENLSPGENIEVKVIPLVRDKESGTHHYGADSYTYKVKLNNTLKYKILSLKNAKIGAKKALEEGNDTYRFAMYAEYSEGHLYNEMKRYAYFGKWGKYNQKFAKISGLDTTGKSKVSGDNFTYNGKTFKIYTLKFSQKLSKTKNKALRSKLQKNVNRLKLSKNGSKTKVKKITNFIIKNRYYRVTNKRNLYTMVFSKKGQCMHYAWEFDIMCDLAGVKSEYVTGYSGGVYHAWNQVKIGKYWYNHDVTWADTGKSRARWCLKGSKNSRFNRTHKLDPIYKTKIWKKAHPLAKKSLKW